jgi:hypothetical protein
VKLLDRFEAAFRDHRYLHRNSNLGNRIADFLYDDLYDLHDSDKFNSRVDARRRVLNPKATSPGIRARRGDGSFGTLIPGTAAVSVPGFTVSRGATATVEIGAEVKIVAKAMIKQIDRVISDLCGQTGHFREKGRQAITVGIAGVNYASRYVSFEGERSYPTDGHRYPHPVQEAAEAERRLLDSAARCYEEFLVLPFVATNEEPFEFRWLDAARVMTNYSAMLVRVLREYDRRF